VPPPPMTITWGVLMASIIGGMPGFLKQTGSGAENCELGRLC
jgi:hypothetical protein